MRQILCPIGCQSPLGRGERGKNGYRLIGGCDEALRVDLSQITGRGERGKNGYRLIGGGDEALCVDLSQITRARHGRTLQLEHYSSTPCLGRPMASLQGLLRRWPLLLSAPSQHPPPKSLSCSREAASAQRDRCYCPCPDIPARHLRRTPELYLRDRSISLRRASCLPFDIRSNQPTVETTRKSGHALVDL